MPAECEIQYTCLEMPESIKYDRS